MSQQKLLTQVVDFLEREGIAYMLTGSLASSLHGEPRATHDIDLVVDVKAAHIRAILAAFPQPEFYLSESAIRDAISQKGMFNLVSVAEGDKVDFWLLKDEPFDRTRFARRRIETIRQKPVRVSTPEDTILMKLSWALDVGGSEKQSTDALRVYEMRHRQLDMAYLESWVGRLGIEESWKELQSNATIE